MNKTLIENEQLSALLIWSCLTIAFFLEMIVYIPTELKLYYGL